MTRVKRKKGRRKFPAIVCGRPGHHHAGLRLVALLEAAKGAVVILAGLGFMALLHRDVQAVAEEIVRHLHFNPASHYPRIFLDAAAHVTDARLWMMALTAAVYATVRIVEAYGLWREQVWAEWFGILSGSIYLPVEVYELTVRISVVKLSILFVNIVVVGWLSSVRWQGRRHAKK